ncbi:hypothetical protein [Pseudomonas viridiflava]|uniref:hypothetical protein n=1 Tax=Pseudomonas viridiflava TaxID=33069 RepID=UPI000F0388AE|nr:hypothetical protein [Pseudomonas viridiflava]
MKEKLSNIFSSISSSVIKISESETASEYKLHCRANGFHVDAEKLKSFLQLINERDRFSVVFSPSNSEVTVPLSNSTPESIQGFVTQLTTWSTALSQNQGELTLIISKRVHRKTLSIYSLELFTKHLIQGNPIKVIERISALAKIAYYLECSELTQSYQSSLFTFAPKALTDSYPTNPESAVKAKHIELRKKSCTIYSIVTIDFTPSDFRLDTPLPFDELNSLFKKLELITCLTYVCDISRLEASGEISFTIKGYTTERIEIPSLDALDISSTEQYFDIYQWAYTDGNIVDKLGICRNLITIHKTDDSLLKLKAGCLESIASNHAIYLKDNLKQYVDVKNKLSEQIQKSSEKASEVAKTINAYLRTSIFSLFSFLLTAFLIRALGKNTAPETPILSSGVYWIFLLIFAVSLIVLLYAVGETNAELRRYKASYKTFRKRYSDLLSREDLNQIFNNDKDFNRDIEYIRKSRKKAVTLWLTTLSIIFIVISVMKCKGL